MFHQISTLLEILITFNTQFDKKKTWKGYVRAFSQYSTNFIHSPAFTMHILFH